MSFSLFLFVLFLLYCLFRLRCCTCVNSIPIPLCFCVCATVVPLGFCSFERSIEYRPQPRRLCEAGERSVRAPCRRCCCASKFSCAQIGHSGESQRSIRFQQLCRFHENLFISELCRQPILRYNAICYCQLANTYAKLATLRNAICVTLIISIRVVFAFKLCLIINFDCTLFSVYVVYFFRHFCGNYSVNLVFFSQNRNLFLSRSSTWHTSNEFSTGAFATARRPVRPFAFL